MKEVNHTWTLIACSFKAVLWKILQHDLYFAKKLVFPTSYTNIFIYVFL